MKSCNPEITFYLFFIKNFSLQADSHEPRSRKTSEVSWRIRDWAENGNIKNGNSHDFIQREGKRGGIN